MVHHLGLIRAERGMGNAKPMERQPRITIACAERESWATFGLAMKATLRRAKTTIALCRNCGRYHAEKVH